MVYAKQYALEIVEAFEDFLEEKGIDIPNEDKEGDDGASIIYGMDFARVLDDTTEVIRKLCKNIGERVDTESWENASVEYTKQSRKLYHKLHRCLKLSLMEENNPLPNGDYLSCHANSIIMYLSKSIASEYNWYDSSVEIWCNYFIKMNDKKGE